MDDEKLPRRFWFDCRMAADVALLERGLSARVNGQEFPNLDNVVLKRDELPR